MSLNYRQALQGHIRSQSNNLILPQQNSKKNQKNIISTQSTQLGTSLSQNRSKNLLYPKIQLNKSSDCHFCKKSQSHKRIQLFLNERLFHKYASSQNYYYTRDINEILASSRTKSVIVFKDYMYFDEEDEYLKRYYFIGEYSHKIGLLAEYYKFHHDISRLFMLPSTNILNHYHDKRRKLEYYKIADQIEKENKDNPKRPPKGIVGDRPEKNTSETSSEPVVLKTGEKDAVGETLLNDISSYVNRGNTRNNTNFSQSFDDLQKTNFQNVKGQIFERRKNQDAQSQNRALQSKRLNQQTESSQTLIEINKKLEQITQNYCEQQSSIQMESIANDENLNNFLKFIQKPVIKEQLLEKINSLKNSNNSQPRIIQSNQQYKNSQKLLQIKIPQTKNYPEDVSSQKIKQPQLSCRNQKDTSKEKTSNQSCTKLKLPLKKTNTNENQSNPQEPQNNIKNEQVQSNNMVKSKKLSLNLDLLGLDKLVFKNCKKQLPSERESQWLITPRSVQQQNSISPKIQKGQKEGRLGSQTQRVKNSLISSRNHVQESPFSKYRLPNNQSINNMNNNSSSNNINKERPSSKNKSQNSKQLQLQIKLNNPNTAYQFSNLRQQKNQSSKLKNFQMKSQCQTTRENHKKSISNDMKNFISQNQSVSMQKSQRKNESQKVKKMNFLVEHQQDIENHKQPYIGNFGSDENSRNNSQNSKQIPGHYKNKSEQISCLSTISRKEEVKNENRNKNGISPQNSKNFKLVFRSKQNSPRNDKGSDTSLSRQQLSSRIKKIDDSFKNTATTSKQKDMLKFNFSQNFLQQIENFKYKPDIEQEIGQILSERIRNSQFSKKQSKPNQLNREEKQIQKLISKTTKNKRQ